MKLRMSSKSKHFLVILAAISAITTAIYWEMSRAKSNIAAIPPLTREEQFQKNEDQYILKSLSDKHRGKIESALSKFQRGNSGDFKQIISGSDLALKFAVSRILLVQKDEKVSELLKLLVTDSNPRMRNAILMSLPSARIPKKEEILSAYLAGRTLSAEEDFRAKALKLKLTKSLQRDKTLALELEKSFVSTKEEEIQLLGLQLLSESMKLASGVKKRVAELAEKSPSPEIKMAALRALKTACPVNRFDLITATISREKNPDVLRVALQEAIFHPSDKMKKSLELAQKSNAFSGKGENPYSKALMAFNSGKLQDTCQSNDGSTRVPAKQK